MLILGPQVQEKVAVRAIDLAGELGEMLRGRHVTTLSDVLSPEDPDPCRYQVEQVIPPDDAQDLPVLPAWQFRAHCEKHGGSETASLVVIAGDDVKARFREAFAALNPVLAHGTFIFAPEAATHPPVPTEPRKASALAKRSGQTLTLIEPDHSYPRLDLMSERGASDDEMKLAGVLYEMGHAIAKETTMQLWVSSTTEALAVSYQMTALALASYGCETACLPKGHKLANDLAGCIELAISLAKDCRNLNDNFPFKGTIDTRWALLAVAFASFHLGRIVNGLGFGRDRVGANRALAEQWRQCTEGRLAALNGLSGVDGRLTGLDATLRLWLPDKNLSRQHMAAQIVLAVEAVAQAKIVLSKVPKFKGVTF